MTFEYTKPAQNIIGLFIIRYATTQTYFYYVLEKNEKSKNPNSIF